MKKIFIILLVYIFNSPDLFSQMFQESNFFEGLIESSIDIADVDGDNDQDILITGLPGYNEPLVALLYLNDGTGYYSLANDTPFEGVEKGSVKFSDLDDDGDQDLIITGSKSSWENPISELYINDGDGNFEEKSVPFVGVENSTIAIADVDSDDDMDVLIAGYEWINYTKITKLYINDGSANFEESTQNNFEGIEYGAVGFSDIDNDDDLDLVISGLNNAGESSTDLYLNNGLGIFSINNSNSLVDVNYSSIAYSDVDSDNDQDLLITGINDKELHSVLYLNDGTGKFTESTETSLEVIGLGAVAFADIDNDKDQDIFITGMGEYGDRVANIFINDGTGKFQKVNSPFLGAMYSSIAVTDVDGDDDLDIFIAGENSNKHHCRLYRNDGTGEFFSNFPEVRIGTIDFADVDGDDDNDVLITGSFFSSYVTKLFINNGIGQFKEDYDAQFLEVNGGDVAFADIDNDNDMDVVISGRQYNEHSTNLYLNDGNGNFSKVNGAPFHGIDRSSIDFADIDGDKYLDLIISGWDGVKKVTELYQNNGDGTYVTVEDTPFKEVDFSSLDFADVDGDNDQDVLIYGYYINPTLYKNNGSGTFSVAHVPSFEQIRAEADGMIKFLDIDGDDDQDVIALGDDSNSRNILKVFLNDGLGNFDEDTDSPFNQIYDPDLFSVADVDSDGDEDVLILEYSNSSLFINDGSGNFEQVSDINFISGTTAFLDLDKDSDKDIIIINEDKAILYINNTFNKINQTITFTPIEDVLPNKNPITLEATASSGLPVSFTITEGQNIALINGNTVDLTGEFGTVTVQAAQLGDETYNPAPPVDQSFEVLNLTSVDDQLTDADLTYFPNPTSNQLTLTLDSPYQGTINLRVLDMTGKVHLQHQVIKSSSNWKYNLDMAGLSTGLYLLEVESGDQRRIVRVGKQ